MAFPLMFRPLAPNLLDISSDPEGTANNLLSIWPQQVWQGDTADLTGVEIDVDMGAVAVTYDSVWLGNTNFGTAFEWRLQTAATQGGLGAASGADDSGTISGWPASGRPATADYPLLVTDTRFSGRDHFYRFASPRTRRWLRITLGDAGNANNWLRAGILRIGLAKTMERCFGFDWKIAHRDGDLLFAPPQGTWNSMRGPEWREYALTFGWLRQYAAASKQEMQYLLELLRWARKDSDFVVLTDPAADHDWHLRSFCGVAMNPNEFSNHFVQHWRGELIMRTIP
jgi:hypothetical protein